jgi:peptide-methionine (S)-S-oxide reductase
MRPVLLALASLLMLASCRAPEEAEAQPAGSVVALPQGENLGMATFAAGCFWCVEPPFDIIPGVVSTTSGFTGGDVLNPTYDDVSAGGTGHTEAVQIVYDSTRVSYAELLDVFWRNVDPLTPNRQFCDVGSQYRSAIFYHGEQQRRLAEASLRALEQSGRFDQPIVTELVPASAFYRAEEYHQDFYKKDPVTYKRYRAGCGRDARLKELWGDPATTS